MDARTHTPRTHHIAERLGVADRLALRSDVYVRPSAELAAAALRELQREGVLPEDEDESRPAPSFRGADLRLALFLAVKAGDDAITLRLLGPVRGLRGLAETAAALTILHEAVKVPGALEAILFVEDGRLAVDEHDLRAAGVDVSQLPGGAA
jgi:hypothetical protein